MKDNLANVVRLDARFQVGHDRRLKAVDEVLLRQIKHPEDFRLAYDSGAGVDESRRSA